MEAIDPKNSTSSKVTSELLEKSKALKEKAKATSERLDALKQQSDKMMGKPTPPENPHS